MPLTRINDEMANIIENAAQRHGFVLHYETGTSGMCAYHCAILHKTVNLKEGIDLRVIIKFAPCTMEAKQWHYGVWCEDVRGKKINVSSMFEESKMTPEFIDKLVEGWYKVIGHALILQRNT